MPNYNDAQVAAIGAHVPMILVSAGAGSGKTRVLTERYFRLLEGDKLTTDQILTLTFTRKAAQEMRERIARRLEADGRIAERRKLPRAPIGTLHAFCERLLREHAMRAGVDPNFTLLDDAETQTLQEESLDQVFNDLWESNDPFEKMELGRLLLDYRQDDLRAGLLNIYRNARTRGLEIASITPDTVISPVIAAMNAKKSIEDYLALSGTPNWEAKKREMAVALASLESLFNTSAEEISWDEYSRASQALSAFTGTGGPKDTAKERRDALKIAYGEWLAAMLSVLATGYLTAFTVLLQRFADIFNYAKEEQGLLDFEDLLLLTRKLLQTDDDTRTYLQGKYRQVMVDEFQDTNPLQFDIVRALSGVGNLFVVGDVKQAIYGFIGSDISVFLGHEQNVLKQPDDKALRVAMHTNYRSRPEVLEPINAIFSSIWREQALGEGFHYEALDAGAAFNTKDEPAVELAWFAAEDKESAEMMREREAAWIARRILQITGRIGAQPLQLTGRAEEQGELTAVSTDYRDVIMLFRSASNIDIYERALRETGIPYYTVRGKGYYQSREVQDLLALLRVLDNTSDDSTMAEVLRSPLVGVSAETLYWLSRDWTEWELGCAYPQDTPQGRPFGRLWEHIIRVNELPAIEAGDARALVKFQALVCELQSAQSAGQPLDLLDIILARTRYGEVLLAGEGGEQRYANVQKLRDIAANFQSRGIFDLSAFQSYLTQISTVSPREASAPLDVEGSNVVRLMTVHAAKGLEASVVFLADAGRAKRNCTDVFLLTHDGKVTAKIPTPDDEMKSPAHYDEEFKRRTELEKREEERLLYVAMTRAKEQLIISGNWVKKEGTSCYINLLKMALGVEEPTECDTVLQVTFEGKQWSIHLWGQTTLRETIELVPPLLEPTLWDDYADVILAGDVLPVILSYDKLAQYEQVYARTQPLSLEKQNGPLRVGVNKALGYHDCPRQYWYRYLLDRQGAMARTSLPPVVEEIKASEKEPEDFDHTEYGKLAHRVLQLLEFPSPAAAQLEGILAFIEREDKREASEMECTKLSAMLLRLNASPVYDQLASAQLLREQRFLMREGDAYIPGIIDVLAKSAGEWRIYDYKTGYPSAHFYRQVGSYALGVQRCLGVTPTTVSLIFLEGEEATCKVRDYPVTAEMLQEARGIMRSAASGIRAEDYHPTPGHICTRCPYREQCPAAPVCE